MLYPAQIREKFKYAFAVTWLIPKENSSYCVLNFRLVWNTSRYERLHTCLACLFVFMVLICNSFGPSSERPRAVQLLIKMLIRLFLKYEGLVLLYRNFVFNGAFTPFCMLFLDKRFSIMESFSFFLSFFFCHLFCCVVKWGQYTLICISGRRENMGKNTVMLCVVSCCKTSLKQQNCEQRILSPYIIAC